ncbi:hypothetical protein J6S35_00610 [Candidatus Saccharibacteria bacterium]|nr:hypothetical protein [Candidatus Saccharibacteria bacterium]
MGSFKDRFGGLTENQAQELKGHWYLNYMGDVLHTEFVEKLKAWKRLKDKGVEFYGWRKNCNGTYEFLARWRGVPPKIHEIIDDLDLLFSGGEE